MAKPITWRNIDAPSFASANSLFNASADRVSGAIDTLTDMAREQGTILQAEKDEQRDINTQQLIQEINAATNRDDLDSVDLNQFDPSQVNMAEVNTRFTDQSNTLIGQEQAQERIDLEGERLEETKKQNKLDNAYRTQVYNDNQKKKSQVYTIKRNDGSTTAYQLDANGAYHLVPELSDGAVIPAEMTQHNAAMQVVNAALAKGIDDPTIVRGDVTRELNKLTDRNGNPLPANADLIDSVMANYADRVGLTAAQSDHMNAMDIQAQVATDQVNSDFAAASSNLEQVTGMPADFYQLADDTPIGFDELEKKLTSDDSWFRSNASSLKSLYDIAVKKGLQNPTERELQYIYNQSMQLTGGTILDSESRVLTDAVSSTVERYLDLKGDSSIRRMVDDWNQQHKDDLNQIKAVHGDNKTVVRSSMIRGNELGQRVELDQPTGYKVTTSYDDSISRIKLAIADKYPKVKSGSNGQIEIPDYWRR